MAGPRLELSIGANVTDAVTGINQVTSATLSMDSTLRGVGQNLPGVGRGLGRVGQDAQTAASALRTIPPAGGPAGQAIGSVGAAAAASANGLNSATSAANQAAAALARLRPGASSAGFALTNVGRVAQDLPFGFIGIQNNLNPLLESFQRLRTETGSSSAAFRALGSSLIGPAGIGLALSIVSSAIVIFQNGISGFNKKTKEAKQKADELAKAIRSISNIEGEAEAGIKGQIVQVGALAKAIGDANLPYAERKRALEELKEINKAYFNDLKIEDAATGKLATTVAEYNKALINSAIQKQFVDEIAKVGKAIADSDEDIRKAKVELNKVTAEQVKQEKDAAAFRKKNDVNANTGIKGAIEAQTKYQNTLIKQADAQKVLNTAVEARKKLGEQDILLVNRLNAATLEGLKIKDLQTQTNSATKKEDAELKALKETLDSYNKQLAKTNQLREKGKLPTFRENDALDLQLKVFDTLRKIDARELQLKLKPELDIDPVLDDLEIGEAIEKAQERAGIKVTIPVKFDTRPVGKGNLFSPADIIAPNGIADGAFDAIANQIKQSAINKQEAAKAATRDFFVKAFTDGAVEGLVSVGDTLGATIAGIFSGQSIGSSIAAGAQALLGIIGGVLQEVGKQIIATSTLIATLKESLKTLFANPFAGIAVGIGLVALGGLLKNIKFNIPGFADGVTGFSGGLALVGEDGPEVVRLPAGSDVIPNGRMGGFNSPSIALIPSLRFSGADFQIMLEKVDKRRSNLG